MLVGRSALAEVLGITAVGAGCGNGLAIVAVVMLRFIGLIELRCISA